MNKYVQRKIKKVNGKNLSCIDIINEWKNLIIDYTDKHPKEVPYTITDVSCFVENSKFNVNVNMKKHNSIKQKTIKYKLK